MGSYLKRAYLRRVSYCIEKSRKIQCVTYTPTHFNIDLLFESLLILNICREKITLKEGMKIFELYQLWKLIRGTMLLALIFTLRRRQLRGAPKRKIVLNVFCLWFQFLNVPLFRNVTLKCLTEIAGVSGANYDDAFISLFTHTMGQLEQVGSCLKRQKPQAPTPQAHVRNRQTRKVANAKGLNRNTNLT